MVIGLMIAGIIAIGRTAIEGWSSATLAVIVFICLYWGGKRMNPAYLILLGAIIGWFFLAPN